MKDNIFFWMEPQYIPWDEIPKDCLIIAVWCASTVRQEDREIAAMRGIKLVTLDPSEIKDITATIEHTWALILAAHRRIHEAAYFLGQGRSQKAVESKWDRRGFSVDRMLSTLTLGVIGRGRIGSAVLQIARSAFKMQVVSYDKIDKIDISIQSLDSVLRHADILSIHVSGDPENHGMIGRRELALLPEGSIVINTAKGEVLDSEALLSGLESGHIRAAALDVLPREFATYNEFRKVNRRVISYAQRHKNLILTPHIGGSCKDAWDGTKMRLMNKARKVRDALGG